MLLLLACFVQSARNRLHRDTSRSHIFSAIYIPIYTAYTQSTDWTFDLRSTRQLLFAANWFRAYRSSAPISIPIFLMYVYVAVVVRREKWLFMRVRGRVSFRAAVVKLCESAVFARIFIANFRTRGPRLTIPVGCTRVGCVGFLLFNWSLYVGIVCGGE